MAGQTVGHGIIVDFARHMNGLIDVNVEERSVRAQPGLFRTALNRALAPHRLQFAPDPSSTDFCTLGGMVANNAGGAHSIRYGSTKDYVRSADVVLATGARAVLGDPRQTAADWPEDAPFRLADLETLLRDNKAIIDENFPDVNKNSSGYNLPETLAPDGLDLRRLIAGSEGTLALVTEVTLGLVPIQPDLSAGLMYFPSRVSAAKAIGPLLQLGPACLELLDDTFIRVVQQTDPHLRDLLPEGCRAALMVEFEGSGEAVKEALAAAGRRVVDELGLATGVLSAYGPEERERLWALRRAAGPLVNRIPGRQQAVLFIEDAAVRPDRLPEFVEGLEGIFAAHGVEATIIGHAGNGNVHVRPILDLRDPADLRKAESIGEAAADLVKSLRGTLSAEHGDGLSRSIYLPRIFGPAYDVFRAVKRLFDPQGILNPGKIVLDERRELTGDLRFGYDYHVVPTGTAFDDAKLRDEAEKCHGCGTCQAYCPAAQALGTEVATGRAKANLIREVLHGKLPVQLLGSDQVKQVMDLCVNCKLCLTLCPTAVDIPWLCVQARAHYVAQHGQTLQNRFLADSRRAGLLGCAAPTWANALNRFRPWRLLLQSMVGIDARRQLPSFARGRGVDATSPATPLGKVAYFAGCFANYHDPVGEGEATVAVLRRHGFQVEVPQLQCCGAAMTTVGSLERARADAADNVRRLKAYVDEGYDIVASAATCGLMVRLEYPQLLETEDAAAVAARTYDIHEYLLALREKGELDTGFRRVERSIVYHSPCHLTAQGLADAPRRLLEMIPGLELRKIEDSCCGIAGTFGMKKQFFDLSMKMGEPLMREIRRAAPELVVTPCGTCNMQIAQATGLPVAHPLRLLWEAYGQE